MELYIIIFVNHGVVDDVYVTTNQAKAIDKQDEIALEYDTENNDNCDVVMYVFDCELNIPEGMGE